MDIVTYVLAKNSVNSTLPDAIEDYLDTHPIHIEEVDPTVPSWAKQPTKPSYTAQEIGAGTYSKPSGGIPKTDLASAVQTSLGKADTALQSYTETDPTVPSWAKAASKPSYTASEVGAIAAPSSPTTGDFLCWNGTAWAATTVPSANGVSF